MAESIPKEIFDGPNRLMSVVPVRNEPNDGIHHFKWSVHFALPFPMPTRKCFSETLQIERWAFNVGIHNHFDRILVLSDNPQIADAFFLHDKRTTTPKLTDGYRGVRVPLTSVAVFDDVFDYEDVGRAYANSQAKVEACVDFLTDYLSRCQLAAPFSCGWLVYPPALHEFGVIYFGVRRIIKGDTKSPVVTEACHATATERSIQNPLFTMSLPKVDADTNAVLQLPYELLAEANVASMKGSSRLAVINSYNAVELLANNVFRAVKTDFLVKRGVPRSMADSLVEEQRILHRTDIRFLTDTGIKEILNASLVDDEKALYDHLTEVKELRNKVAHAGLRPTTMQGRESFKTCSKVVEWLATAAGLPVKSYYPNSEEIADKFFFSFVNSEQIGQNATVPVWDIKYTLNGEGSKVRRRLP